MDELALAGGQIDRPNVVPARVAVIETDQDRTGEIGRYKQEPYVHLGQGRQIANFASRRIDGMEIYIFAAILIPEEQD